MVRKCFWLEQSALMPSPGWPNTFVWLFQSIGGLQQQFCQCFTNKCCQKYEFYYRKGYRKSNAICIMVIMSFTLWQPLYPLFSFCFTLYKLEVIPRCCNNLSYIFIHTYFHCQASKVKQMVWQKGKPVVNVAFHEGTIVWCFCSCFWPSMLLPQIT